MLKKREFSVKNSALRPLDNQNFPCYIECILKKGLEKDAVRKTQQRDAATGCKRCLLGPEQSPPWSCPPICRPGRDLPLQRTRAAQCTKELSLAGRKNVCKKPRKGVLHDFNQKTPKEFLPCLHSETNFVLLCKQGGTVELCASPLVKNRGEAFLFCPGAARPPEERRHYNV